MFSVNYVSKPNLRRGRECGITEAMQILTYQDWMDPSVHHIEHDCNLNGGYNHYIYVTLFQGNEYDDFKIFHLAAIPAQRPNAPPKNSSLTVSGCISSAILHDYRQNLILNCTKYVRQSVCQKLTIITNLLIF